MTPLVGVEVLEAQPGGRATAVAGIAAGVLGGAAMALFLVLAAAANGLDPLAPLDHLGETFTNPGAPHGKPAFVVYGLFVHLAVAALLGIVFVAMLPPRFPTTCAVVAGIGFTVPVMAIMTALVLPAANPELRAAMPALGGSWVVAHAVYGAVLGIGPRLRERLAG